MFLRAKTLKEQENTKIIYKDAQYILINGVLTEF